jgi:methyltransferase
MEHVGNGFYIMLLVLIIQRLSELVIAKRNATWITKQGGYEVGAEHYKWMVLMHSSWFVSMLMEHLYFNRGLNGYWQFLLPMLLFTQVLRYTVIATLGRFWNTRIFILPDAPRIQTGIYRFITHPNYWIVRLEILLVPLLFKLYITSFIYTILNFFMLRVRIREEEQGLLKLRSGIAKN